ncbi:MAG: carboxypeptidase regulatory-like domain-containing protein, partial [Anaerolineae bacterium]
MMTGEGESSTGKRRTTSRLRWIPLILLGLLLLGLAWFAYTADPEITALRNVVHYKVVQILGGPRLCVDELPGSLSGRIQDESGVPVAGAVVLVASPLGEVYTAETDPAGWYRIERVPPGRYVPVAGKRGYDDALQQACAAGLCIKDVVRVRPGKETADIDLTLAPVEAPVPMLDDSLVVSPTVEVSVGAPFPSTSLRTHFTFERAGLRVNDCWLYEPLAGEGPLPTMLLVLPGPVAGWEIIPVPFAAEGFSVLACYPLRGIDIDEDAGDLLTALAYVREGRRPSRADPERLALVGASFTSLHTWRLLQLTDLFDVTLVLGGMADGFAFRHDVEMGTAQTRPPFDQVLMALGFPNTSPELYFKYSVMYHLEGLPPACLLH